MMTGIMINFKLRYCKARMLAYIHGELPPHSRRRMARYLDECPRCYAEYQRQRALIAELQWTLPAFGAASGDQLARIWSRVQADMRRRPGSVRPLYHAGYGLAALMLAVLLLLPLAGTGGASAAASLTQPEPALRLVASTTLTPGSPVLSATLSAPATAQGGQTSSVPETVPPNTPRPFHAAGE